MILFLLLLLAWTPSPLVAIQGTVKVDDSNPVRVGDTATLTCTYTRRDNDSVDHVTWLEGWPERRLTGVLDKCLFLKLYNETDCEVQRKGPALSNYTFGYSCHGDVFRLSIINMTAKDIDVNNTWCCKVQHGTYWIDGYECGHIKKAAPLMTKNVAPTEMVETTEARSEKPSSFNCCETVSRLTVTCGVFLFVAWWLLP